MFKEKISTILHMAQEKIMKYDVDQFQVSCYTYEGIDAVKDALRAGIACSTEVVPIRINLIAPPLYVMTTSTTEKGVSIQKKRKRIKYGVRFII